MAEPDIAAEGERKRRDGSERGNENTTAEERSKWALIVEGTTLHCVSVENREMSVGRALHY